MGLTEIDHEVCHRSLITGDPTSISGPPNMFFKLNSAPSPINGFKKQETLESALQNMSHIAYNPISKQLHFISRPPKEPLEAENELPVIKEEDFGGHDPFKRVETWTSSLSKTDTSSLSSLSVNTEVDVVYHQCCCLDSNGCDSGTCSLATDFEGTNFVDLCLGDDNVFVGDVGDVRLGSSPGSRESKGQCGNCDPGQCQVKGKKRNLDIGGFFAKNLFPWKSEDKTRVQPSQSVDENGYVPNSHCCSENATNQINIPRSTSSNHLFPWRLLTSKITGNSHPTNGLCLNSRSLHRTHSNAESMPDTPSSGLSESPLSKDERRKSTSDIFVTNSTTALILEDRPSNLPEKSAQEKERHQLEYDKILQQARRREMKEAKLRRKQMHAQLKYEDVMARHAQIWRKDILPNFDNMVSTEHVRNLWWRGLPPCIRGTVWKLAVGNDLNVTSELYSICELRARDRLKLLSEQASNDTNSTENEDNVIDKESSVELIKLDISRTFPQLCIFQKGGPYYEILHSLLGAYVCYRPDVGYVQGMSFLAAILLLNMDVADAFISFANLLNKPCQLAFFRLDEVTMKAYYNTYEQFFELNLPKLFRQFNKLNLTPDLYLTDWMYTIYSKSLPLDVASRIWDLFFRDGEEFLFCVALGILRLYEGQLMGMDFIHAAQLLTRLPESISQDELFECIASVKMTLDKKKFPSILSTHMNGYVLTGHRN